ncbi:acyl-CoA dehydrogenase family protein [Estrella lausannensis]|uniref:Putative acyl-CoA dehydrogenase FadE10 n=1 Tax=Estrella lausannensis TaxID=483423 RepID=A0A0H5E2P9_9BACT|nr:acyl-CoA dehydrogenase family protein [Estrella lausannensis]CRX37475.1 putative acyl-CoA dehydrogenase FadE10 [Estrella lausannensis]
MSTDLQSSKKTDDENPLIAAAQGMSEGKQEAMRVTEDAREKVGREKSIGGKLFIGEFDKSKVMPFPMQSAEDKKIGDEFIAKLEAFLVKNLDPEEVDRTKEIPEIVLQGLGEMGIFAMKIPKEYGGLGLSQTNYNRVVMKVSSYCGATAGFFSAHQSIGVPQPLLMYGTEEQKKKYFPRFRKGEISAFALTEVDVGSDPARMEATCDLSSDGSHYILNGTKLWCTNGTIADVIVVMAKTKPKVIKGKERTQISAFILEMDSPGVEVTHRCEFMGLGGIYNGMIRFTNVKIPKENLIWEEGRGLAMALGTINVGRLTLPAACTGGAKQCLSIARRFGKSRHQWGQPIGQHEPGREKIAYIAATTFAMEALTYLTSAYADEHKMDIRIEAAMAKLFCTESLWKITDMTLQLRGGRGFETARSLRARGEEPFPVERAMRDCRINTILEGSSEIMKLFLAREAMDPHFVRLGALMSPKSSIGDKVTTAFKALLHYAVWLPKNMLFASSTDFEEAKELKPHFQFIEKASKKLAHSLFTSMMKYQAGLEKRQLILGRMMEIGTELFAIAAACSFALAKSKELNGDKTPIALANYFATISERRIQERFQLLKDNDDKETNALAKKVLADEMRWLEEGIIWIGKKE